MVAEEPKLRTDLVISRQDASVILKDPTTGRFFRFGEAEDFIVSQLDGSTSSEVIRERAREKFGSPPAQEDIEAFVAALRRLRLLETAGTAPPPPVAQRRPFRGNPLYFRLRAFDPDPLLDRLITRLSFCFTAGFVGFSAAVILLGLGVAVIDWPEITRDVRWLYRFEMVVVGWVIIFAVTTAHEFAHGLTCKRFGGHVHEMGFLLIYFQLAFYCNVSDAYLFPEKAKRLWVTFAGPYFELFLWALAVLIWRITEPGTWVSSVALVVVVTSAFKLFINLNPLIKLDGYYLLSDALGIPNLRAHASRYLRSRLAALLRLSRRTVEHVTARERRIYLAYGLLAGGYSVWLLGYIAWALGGFLTVRYQGTGAVMYAGMLALLFQAPLRRAVSRPPLLRAGVERLGAVKRPVKLLLLAALLVAVLFIARWELAASGEFAVAPRLNADVRASVEGLIEAIEVAEGDVVKRGDVIARLSDRDYRADLRRIEAEMEEKRARLKMLRAGTRREEIELATNALATARTKREHAGRRYDEARRLHATRLAKATTDVAKADERLKYARNEMERSRALFAVDLISRRQFEEAEERMAVREKEREAAQAELRMVTADDLSEFQRELAVSTTEAEETATKLKLLEAGSRPEEIEATEAEVTRLEGQRRYLLEQLHLVNVTSPVAGIVITPRPKEIVGRYMTKGDLIVEVHELRTISAEIAIPESEIGEVKLGQRVALKTRAFPETTFVGTVSAIAPVGVKEDEAWRGKVFRVTTQIDNPNLVLRPGMTGTAKIFCGSRPVVELLTRRLARYVRVEFWSWW